MRIRIFTPAQQRQRGQTMVLVAFSIFTLVAMAALAIDLTTLYEARTEMQRAADAAALAGAKAFVESGTTTDPSDANLKTLANAVGSAYITQLLAQNEVGSVAPTLVSSTPDYTTHPGNPRITVVLERTNVPTFFARIFGRRLATVRATAVAEAYNSSLPPGGGSNMPPVAPKCIKPWLIPNLDPRAGAGVGFINETTGALNRPGVYPGGVIGERIALNSGCTNTGCSALNITSILTVTPPNVISYIPASLSNAASGTCPSCAGGSDYEKSSACCDTANASQYQCGLTSPGLAINLLSGLLTNTVSSVECLLGASGPGPGAGQDEIGLGTAADPPANTFGNFLADNGRDPIEIRTHSGPLSGQIVNTSPSVVTLPIFAVGGLSGLLSVLQVHVIGFMQAFVEKTETSGEVDIYVLNISGCGPNVNPAAPPVSGGGTSPVPVRLIH
jgi:hypothetical protein